MNFTEQKRSIEALERAAERAGTVTALCDLLKVSRRSYYYWLDGTPVPPEIAKKIQDHFGDITAAEIRPDIFS